MPDYLAANKANWDDRVPIHVGSRFYDVEGWLETRPGPRSWELEFLGDVSGLEVAHLQCHFGLDSLQLADAGARVTGLDFSEAAIDAARALAVRAGLTDRATFVQADVYEAATALGAGRFDLVYVSLGALCWLPSVDRWAEQVGQLLVPGGRLYIHDGHPFEWALADDELVVAHTYFEEQEPHTSDLDVTYTDGEDSIGHTVTYEWTHSIGEIVTALIGHGLVIDALVEHDWTVWQRFPWLSETGDGRWMSDGDHPRVPLSYTLTARRA